MYIFFVMCGGGRVGGDWKGRGTGGRTGARRSCCCCCCIGNSGWLTVRGRRRVRVSAVSWEAGTHCALAWAALLTARRHCRPAGPCPPLTPRRPSPPTPPQHISGGQDRAARPGRPPLVARPAAASLRPAAAAGRPPLRPPRLRQDPAGQGRRLLLRRQLSVGPRPGAAAKVAGRERGGGAQRV